MLDQLTTTPSTIDAAPDQAQLIAAMPKAELHLHLDGSLRPATVADLAARQGLELPVPAGQVKDLLTVPAGCGSLVDYLERFITPIQVLQTPEALERVTYELCQDVRGENVRYVEIRFAPILHTTGGMSLSEVIAAVVRGWDAGRRQFDLVGGIILCGFRSLDPALTQEVAEAGLPFLGNGVIGFDLAGDEANYSVLLHRFPLDWAREAGYPLTIHAGEAAGARSVRDAVEVVGARRIGHGTHSGDDPALLSVLRDRWITLEMCPTSNLHTRAVDALANHPLGRYYRQGVPVTINCDNRTVSDTTMTQEMTVGAHLGLALPDLARITLHAIEAGFGEPDARRQLLAQYRDEMQRLGISF